MGVTNRCWSYWLVAAVAVVSVPVWVRADESAELTRLRRQVRVLSESLAAATAEADALRARLDGRAYGMGGKGPDVDPQAGVRAREFRVLDVNHELGMVILDGGRGDGLKPGLQLAVIEKDRAVATVRIVDVRMAVAGAVIQDVSRGGPSVHDRAVLVTGSRN